MRKSIKWTTLFSCVVMFFVSLILSFSFSATSARADAGRVFEMEYGASVKLKADTDGLRFIVKMDEDYYKWIVENELVELWGYVAPVEEFDKLDRIGGEYKDLAKRVGGKLDKNKIYADDGYYRANIAITNLYAAEYHDKSLTAIMFIVDKTGDTPKYIYADFAKDEMGVNNIEAQIRTQYEVINAAMLDGKTSYEEKLLANYKWYGKGNYPIAVETQAQYDALVAKASKNSTVQSAVSAGKVFVNNTVTTSSTITASKGYFVSFYDGNKLIDKQFVANGGNASAPTITKAGYELIEWIGSYTSVTKNQNVYAKWRALTEEYIGATTDAISTHCVTLANGKTYEDATALLGQKVVLESGELLNGATPQKGAQEGGTVDQAYLAFNGDYALNDYIALDFTGKNMPEIAFFAKNYNNSMYANGTSKQGIVVYTGITDYQGNTVSVNVEKMLGGVINYGFPYMLQDTGDGSFCAGAHAESKLGRANLVDGTHYRVIMGFTGSGHAITLHWCLYNLDTKTVVEQSSMTTWNFFTGSNAQVGNKTINDLAGSIVLYGKFGTHTVLDKVYDIYQDTTILEVAHELGMKGYSLTLGTGALGTTNGDQSDLGGYAGNNENNNGYQDCYAFKGKYSFDDYVAFDFTGKNMPEIAFFAKNYDNYMYSENGGKQGVVVASGIMAWNGTGYSPVGNYCQNVVVSGPYMANFQGDGGGWAAKDISINIMAAIEQAKLARANLEDNKHYRVIMGFSKASEKAITLNYLLYDLDTNTIVEEVSKQSWGVFANSNTNFYAESTTELFGAGGDIVLYGKFANVTTTIDKIWGVFEDTNISKICGELGMFTVTFQNWDGTILQQEQYDLRQTPTYNGQTPYKCGDALMASYEFAGWDKEIAAVTGDITYTAVFTGTFKEGITLSGNQGDTYGVEQSNNKIVLKASGIGDGANYTLGQNNGGYVHQSYLALDGNYALNDYVAFDFTGKNLPEIAFFSKNYNDSMYAEGTSKQGIVVVTGITTWDGQLGSGVNGNGTEINYGFPYMIQKASDGGFVDGAFKSSALGRANLVDGTHYRVIMGFTGSGSAITLNWYLYNLDTNTVVEQGSMTTWNFFTGSNAQVGNMTINDLSGSIVLYGKFGVACELDKIHGVFENTDIDTVASGLNNATEYVVTFKDAEDNIIAQGTYRYGELPQAPADPDKAPTELYNYVFSGWDKAVSLVTANVTYKAAYTAILKDGLKQNNTTDYGHGIVLNNSNIGGNAHYSGSNNQSGVIGTVNQSYLAFDGNYGFNDYVAFDFTGKNMPSVAFFANNYNESMYYQNGDKYGLVVLTGLTTWQGALYTEYNDSKSVWDGTGLLVAGPQMLHNTLTSGKNGVLGFQAVTSNSGNNTKVALGRANLDDSKTYRVIMGIEAGSNAYSVKIVYWLYNLDDNTEVETFSAETYNFFTTGFAKDGQTRDQFCQGSIVLYGHFGTPTTLDVVHGIYEDTTLADVASILTPAEDGGNEGGEEGGETDTTNLLGYENYTDQFDFYAYGSYSDGWYEIDGEKYYVGKHLGNLKQYSLYGGAGLTIYFPQESFKISEDPQTIVNAKKLLDDLAKVGITKTILNDGRISWLSLLETMDARFVTGDAIDMEKLKEYVKSCLEPYATYPGVYGIQLGDEPKYTVLNSYAAVYKAVKEVCEENNWNLHIQYNLNPMIYANEIFDGGYYDDGNQKKFNEYLLTDSRITELKKRYTAYINAFLNAMEPDSIMYDDYPLLLDNSSEVIRDLYIANLQIVAEAAAAAANGAGVKFYHITQTFENVDNGSKVRRQVTEKGAQWMNNMLLGFGVKQIAYYTYYTRNESNLTGDESYVDGSSFVDYNGNPTDLYYTMQGIMSNNQIFAKVIMQFNYKQSSVYWNKSGYFSSTPDYISYATSATSFEKATVSYTTKDVGVLVTELCDEAKGNYMYMAMNINDPDSSTASASITMTFSGYTHALVYDGNGNFTNVTLNNGVYTATLNVADAVYVIPYN